MLESFILIAVLACFGWLAQKLIETIFKLERKERKNHNETRN